MSTLTLFYWNDKIMDVKCDGHQISPNMFHNVLLELHSIPGNSCSYWEQSSPREKELHINFDVDLDQEWLAKYGSAYLQK